MPPPSILTSLSPEKRALLQKMLKQKDIGVSKDHAAAIGRLPRRKETDLVPLTYLQEGMWFIDQLDPGKATYNVPAASRLTGNLDVPALENALNEIVRRHEALRTTFQQKDGKLQQVIAPYQPISFPVIDLTGTLADKLHPADEREEAAIRLATEEARSPFDLAKGPMFRASLIRLGEDDHVLVLNIHHIVTDGWSMGVLSREIIALYEAYVSGKPSPLPELPVQFGDYAVWQRKWLSGETLDKLLSYWKRTLGGSRFVLDLPTDRPRPPLQTGRGQHHTFSISKELTRGLISLSQQENVTLFVAMLAVFKVLLYCYARQDDIIVGTPIANRNKSELEGLIGYFVNLLPLRSDLSGNPSLKELMQRVNKVTIDANAHQELPFGKLVEELQPRRDASRNPIFQVEFTLLNPEHAPPVYGYGFRSPVQQKIEIQGVTLTPMEIESGVSKFDLTVLLWDMPGGVSGTFEYNMDLFEHYTIIQLAENYQTLLRHTVATPNIRISVLKDVFAQRRHTIGANRQTPARGTPTVAKRRKQIRPRKLKKIPRRRRKGDF